MKKFLLLMLLMGSMLMVSCGPFQVNEGQRGVRIKGGKFAGIEEPGRGWEGFWESVKPINVSTISVPFSDDSMLAGGNKPVSVRLSFNVRRTSNSSRLQNAYSDYNAVMTNDDALRSEVSERAAESVKQAITKIGFWAILESDLGQDEAKEVVCAEEGSVGRDAFKQCITSYLTQPLHDIGLDLIDIQVVDVSPSPELAAIVIQLSTVNEQSALAESRLALIGKQITEAEQLTLLAEEQAKVYASNPELLLIRLAEIELEEATIWANSEGNTIIVNQGGGNVLPTLSVGDTTE